MPAKIFSRSRWLQQFDVLGHVDLAASVGVEQLEALPELVVGEFAGLVSSHICAELVKVELSVAVVVGRLVRLGTGSAQLGDLLRASLARISSWMVMAAAVISLRAAAFSRAAS